MLLPLPFGPMIPKNSPSSTVKLTSSSACCTSYVDAVEGVEDVLLERRPPLVRKPEGLRDARDLDHRTAHTRSANHGSSRLNSSRPTTRVATAIPIGMRRPNVSNASAAVIVFAGQIRVEHERPDVLEHLRERVEEHEVARERREEPDRVDDRRGVEEELEPELPHLAHVAEADEERREDQRHAEREAVQLDEQRDHEQPIEPRCDLLPRDEAGDDDGVDEEREAGRDRRRHRDHQTREHQLAQERLPGDERRHAERGGVREEPEQHDPDQQGHARSSPRSRRA